MSNYYNNEHREDNTQYNDNQLDEDFEYNYELCEETLAEMKDEINDSNNQFLLQFCNPGTLMKLIEEGNHTLPKYLQEKPNKKTSEELLSIPEPVDINDWTPVDVSNGWITLKTQTQMKEEKVVEQARLEEEVRQAKLVEELAKQMKEMELQRARTEANKHNWTMTKEMRGIKPKPVAVEQPKLTKSQKKSRRRRRGGFKVNKTMAVIME